MSDIIKLLPDSVANQIAAGEVIQRPASVVKELLENSIDANASSIKVIIKDSGKSLIQVVDNGIGMSETDARMSFERHATSKIKKAEDLFSISSMGFRGEALASIAAIAQVEMKSRREDDELGTFLKIEGSTITSQEECSASTGTTISVKNLFYNVPARRKFLKSPSVEMRHIIEEFQRISLVNNRVSFSLFHNKKPIYQLISGNQKQRIIALYGKSYNERLIPVDQSTERVSIKGFVGKPEYAKKTRGEQFFFVNGRYIKYPYLHNAIENAFQELLSEESFPTYFLYIEVPPEDIDINIHPTKTEINLTESKMIYAFLRAAIKQSLGKHNITPTLDFDTDPGFNFPNFPKDKPINPPMPKVNPSFNPFESSSFEKENSKSESLKPMYDFIESFDNKTKGESDPIDETNTEDSFQKEVELFSDNTNKTETFIPVSFQNIEESSCENKGKILQVQNRYIVSNIKSGLLIIDQQKAHERILYESYLEQMNSIQSESQQELFPHTIRFSPQDAEIIREIKDDLHHLGFVINEIDSVNFMINGRPANMQENDLEGLIEGLIDNYKKGQEDLCLNKKLSLARSLAINTAIKSGMRLHEEQMQSLIDNLFACSMPEVSIDGKSILSILSTNELELRFK
ncbi:MAG: DNA mismatch repair endonuclease MutL [Hyphomicrobiales bacterium]